MITLNGYYQSKHVVNSEARAGDLEFVSLVLEHPLWYSPGKCSLQRLYWVAFSTLRKVQGLAKDRNAAMVAGAHKNFDNSQTHATSTVVKLGVE